VRSKHTIASSFVSTLMEMEASDLAHEMVNFQSRFLLGKKNGSAPKYKIVIDACVVRNEIRRYLSTSGKPTFIQEANRSGIAEIHAPRWLETELKNSTLPSLYKTENISTRILDRAAEEILGEIKIHENYSHPITENAPPTADVKDEPYVRLATDLDALGVFTTDKGFREKYQINAFKEDKVLQMRQLARLLNCEIQILNAGNIGISISATFFEDASKEAAKILKKVPPSHLILGGFAIAGGAYFYLKHTKHGRDNRRRYLDNTLNVAAKGFNVLADFRKQVHNTRIQSAEFKELIEQRA